jgi:hypothetical protein
LVAIAPSDTAPSSRLGAEEDQPLRRWPFWIWAGAERDEVDGEECRLVATIAGGMRPQRIFARALVRSLLLALYAALIHPVDQPPFSSFCTP